MNKLAAAKHNQQLAIKRRPFTRKKLHSYLHRHDIATAAAARHANFYSSKANSLASYSRLQEGAALCGFLFFCCVIFSPLGLMPHAGEHLSEKYSHSLLIYGLSH
jgi:hypothetical protein